MSWEPIVIVALIIYMGTLCYVLYKKCSREISEDQTRGISSSGHPGQALHGNESSDEGRISDEEKKYKRYQLIRSRMEYRQISSTPLSDTKPETTTYRVQEISPCDLESGVLSAEVSQTALRQLTKMGYDTNVCEKALKAVGGSDVEAAVYWIFEHKTDKLTSPAYESPPDGVPTIKGWEQNSDGRFIIWTIGKFFHLSVHLINF